jgi:tyrosinase
MAKKASTTPFVRKDIWTLAPNDPIVTSYAKAVAAMRKRKPSDPTSWTYQAAIHGTQASSPPPLANQCEHKSWYFVAWHRMYLYYFEQIVRAAVVETGGPADWALPYWNYGLDGRNATLPVPFRDQAHGGLAPLHLARNPGLNDGTAQIAPKVTSAAIALARTQFIGIAEFGGDARKPPQFAGATGKLEATPHNDMHNAIGGLMQSTLTAAQDPIFWLHHANIDRLWSAWIGQGGGRANPGTADWTGKTFTFFDENGKKVSKRCDQVLDTIRDLNYTYLPSPSPKKAKPPAPQLEAALAGSNTPELEPELVGASEQPVRLAGSAAQVAVPIEQRAVRGLLAGADAEPRRVYLNIEDIEAEANPGTIYGVYVNLPEDAEPDVEDAHYVGNVSFFGIERSNEPRGDEHAHGLRVAMEITDLVRDLRASGRWDDQQLQVTFKPIHLIQLEEPDEAVAALKAAAPADPPVSIGRVSVFYG